MLLCYRVVFYILSPLRLAIARRCPWLTPQVQLFPCAFLLVCCVPHLIPAQASKRRKSPLPDHAGSEDEDEDEHPHEESGPDEGEDSAAERQQMIQGITLFLMVLMLKR